MENKIENPPAFPGHYHPTLPEIKVPKGMTLRDYFAAKAPEIIPTWFKAVLPEKPIEPKHWSSLPENDPFKKDIENWHKDPCYDLPEETAWYQTAWDVFREKRSQWETDCEEAKYFQWRMYYADAMLRARIQLPDTTTQEGREYNGGKCKVSCNCIDVAEAKNGGPVKSYPCLKPNNLAEWRDKA